MRTLRTPYINRQQRNGMLYRDDATRVAGARKYQGLDARKTARKSSRSTAKI